MRPRWTFYPLRGRRAAGGATLLVSGAATVPTQLKVDDPGYQRAIKTVEEGYEDREAVQRCRDISLQTCLGIRVATIQELRVEESIR